MCKAFSCIVTRIGKVYWKLGLDSHDDVIELAGLKDQTSDPDRMMFARVEIVPKNDSYLKSNKWVLKIDEKITPTWLGDRHEKSCWSAWKNWKIQLDKVLVYKEIINPIKIRKKPEISDKQIVLLKEWASVRDSVRAYAGSFFNLPIKDWKYTENIKTKGYPFQCIVDLWEQGIVPSFDGETWRLHTKDGIAFEINKEELRESKY